MKIRISFLLLLLVWVGGCATLQRTGNSPSTANDAAPSKPDPRALYHFVDGVILDLNENPAAALLSYQEALLYDSTSAALYFAIGKDYLMLGKEESGLRSLNRCLELEPDHVEGLVLTAKVHFNQGDWQRAESYFQRVIEIDSAHAESYFNLALIYLQNGQGERAARMYEKILALQTTPAPQILLGLGELYIELARFEDAADLYRRLIEINPGDGTGYYGVGVCQEALGDTASAITQYQRSLLLEPDMAQARNRLSQLYRSQGHWDDAIMLFQGAVKRDSTDILSWLEIAEVQREKGDSLSAVNTLENVKRRFEDNWRPSLDLGRLYLDGGDNLKAFHEFHRVTDMAPDVFWGWLFGGIAMVHHDSIGLGEEFLTKALDIIPEHPLGNYYLGSVLSQEERPGEAIPRLEKALAQRPDWVAALIPLASAYESIKEYAVSDSLFRRALDIEPDNALLLNNYGYSLSLRGEKLDEALSMAQKALSLQPENGAYLDTVGWIYFLMGDAEKARSFVEKAYESSRDSAEVIDHLGDIYFKLGLKEKAVAKWREALEMDGENSVIKNKIETLGL